MQSAPWKIIIVGGVAAGMSAASKARRNNARAEIIVLEKSGYVSYGACGLPYYISDDIRHARQLIAITAEDFRSKRNIDVRLYHEGVSFDPKRRVVRVKDLQQDELYELTYDKLIIATGARPVIPPLSGMDRRGVFVLRSMEDGIQIKEYIESKAPQHAVIVGGGYIGLEMAEALSKQNIGVTVVEMQDQLLTNFDADMAGIVEKELQEKNCEVIKSDGVKAILGDDQVEVVQLLRGRQLKAGLVILSVGIRPNVEFALSGGVQLGRSGAIAVSTRMQTNIIDVYAAGDCAEAKNLVSGKDDYIPLGTTANKQGRIAGDNATGVVSHFKGMVGTAAVKVFDLEIARCGITENQAKSLKLPFKTVSITDKSRAGYYPHPQNITVKLIFHAQTGRLLGGQMIGKEGVAKRIDVLATALHQKMTVMDIAQLDLSYAPPFAPVWDPLLIAANQAVKEVQG